MLVRGAVPAGAPVAFSVTLAPPSPVDLGLGVEHMYVGGVAFVSAERLLFATFTQMAQCERDESGIPDRNVSLGNQLSGADR
jgi:hypothetical protein